MYQKAKGLFLGLMFFTPLFANCAQLPLERPPDTPIQTEPTCWEGHSIHCWEHQGNMVVSHTYPPEAQPTWSYKNETRQLLCFYPQHAPFLVIHISPNEPKILIQLPNLREPKDIFTGRSIRTCQFRHKPETNTYSILLIRT